MNAENHSHRIKLVELQEALSKNEKRQAEIRKEKTDTESDLSTNREALIRLRATGKKDAALQQLVTQLESTAGVLADTLSFLIGEHKEISSSLEGARKEVALLDYQEACDATDKTVNELDESLLDYYEKTLKPVVERLKENTDREKRLHQEAGVSGSFGVRPASSKRPLMRFPQAVRELESFCNTKLAEKAKGRA